MTSEELRDWLDDPANVERLLADSSRWRRSDGGSMVLNYPPSGEDIEIPVTLAPDQLEMIDNLCERLARGSSDSTGFSDRSSVVRAAVAWFMLLVERAEKERRETDGPDVPVTLRYDSPDNSRSLLLLGASANRGNPETGTAPVTLPHALAHKLSQRGWKYLVAEEQVIDHLRATGQATPGSRAD